VNKKIANYVLIITGLFCLSIVFTFVSAGLHRTEAKDEFQQLASESGFIKNFNFLFIFLFIFFNNTLKTLIVLFAGFFFGIAPLIFIIINGQVIGLVIAVSYQKEGWARILLGLGPHGIFEIPALIIASSYGLWLGVQFYKKLRFNQPFRPALKLAWSKYLRLVLPMLLIAALIETFITTALLQMYR
jgi:stage II sporulation protein M